MAKSGLVGRLYENWWAKEFEKAGREENYRKQWQLFLGKLAKEYPDKANREKLFKHPIIRSILVAETTDLVLDFMKKTYNSYRNNFYKE